MGLLTWLIVGIIVGIIGALVGGWLTAGAVFNTHNAISEFNLTTLIVAFLGAVIVLYTARLLKSDRIIIVNSPASRPMIWASKATAACHPSKKLISHQRRVFVENKSWSVWKACSSFKRRF